jgi:protein required for attachment to host cells
MKHERIWYVVMNSNRARILRGLPEPHAPAASELSLQSRHLRLRDHLQDRPTRSFSSGSPGRRSAVEVSSDPLREDLLRFLHDVQDFLAGERQADAFDSLVVVAPDEVIGLWRQALKDPFVLEFLNLKDEYSESELEDALIQHLQSVTLTR